MLKQKLSYYLSLGHTVIINNLAYLPNLVRNGVSNFAHNNLSDFARNTEGKFARKTLPLIASYWTVAPFVTC